MVFPIEWDLQEEGRLRFTGDAQFQAFVEGERDAWAWTDVALQRSANPGDVMYQVREHVSKLRRAVSDVLSNVANGNVENATSLMENYYRAARRMPLSSSPRGLIVKKAFDTLGEQGALGALAAVMGGRFDGGDSEQVRGVFMAHELLSGTGKAARQSVQEGLSNVLDRAARQQERAERAADALDARVAQFDDTARVRLARLLRTAVRARRNFIRRRDHDFDRLSQATSEMLDRINVAANEANESIRLTEKTYKEHMALQGPVTYWRTKASEHRNGAKWAAAVGLTFALFVVGYIYADGAWRVLDLVKRTVIETKQWQVSYVVLVVAAFLLAVVFWIGRLVSRTYVSQSHLALDADERAVMVQTYLALTNDGKVTEAERALVLASLFRASSDGLVKDDGAPDIGVAGLVSKLGVGSGPQPGR